MRQPIFPMVPVIMLTRIDRVFGSGRAGVGGMASIHWPKLVGYIYFVTALLAWLSVTVNLRAGAGLARLDAQDAGVVMKHGDGPNQCDFLGARDVWVWKSGGTYYMHYDGAGPEGWLACLATR